MLLNKYDNPYEINSLAATAFKPPLRMTVSEAAAKSLYINEPGGYSGFWDPLKVPYMIEPMNIMASRHYEAMAFVGPARSGKTKAVLEGFLAYTITCDNGNTLVVHMTKETAERYSKLVLSPMIYESEDIYSLLSKKSVDDNMGFKRFINGMSVVITHPSPTMLSAIGYRSVLITDFDRMDDSNGEGSIFEQAKKRTQNYMSRGICMVESSPGRDLLDPSWQPGTQHEAPPTSGIISIYNRSFRKRWYWPCPDCGEYFQATPGTGLFSLLPEYEELLTLVKKEDLIALANIYSSIVCPCCGSVIEENKKNRMNEKGVWLSEGQYIKDGVISGDVVGSNIAGYYLGGVAARYQSWSSMILGYLQGLREYVLTGTEETLKGKINLDFGDVYVPRAIYEASGGNNLKERKEDYERYYVPDWTRVLLASVDVQGGRTGRFVVQVHAIGEYLRQCVVDRFDIAYADDDQTTRRVNPGASAPDWDLLLHKVINASYKTHDGKKLLIYMTGIDTGGEGDTTNMAYQFYRRCKKLKVHNKVVLFKGRSNKAVSPIVQSFGQDANGNKMRDVPIYLLDTSFFKDVVASMLRKKDTVGIYLHLPKWLPLDFFDELQAEIKDEKGKWVKVRQRNEALDLCVYILALCWKLKLNSEGFKWDTPPIWCNPLESNNHVVSVEYAQEARGVLVKEKTATKQTNPFVNKDWVFRR